MVKDWCPLLELICLPGANFTSKVRRENGSTFSPLWAALNLVMGLLLCLQSWNRLLALTWTRCAQVAGEAGKRYVCYCLKFLVRLHLHVAAKSNMPVYKALLCCTGFQECPSSKDEPTGAVSVLVHVGPLS